MRDTITNILKEYGLMKVVELTLQVWLQQNNREIPIVWEPTHEELAQLAETRSQLMSFLIQMKEEKLIDVDLDWKYMKLVGRDCCE